MEYSRDNQGPWSLLANVWDEFTSAIDFLFQLKMFQLSTFKGNCKIFAVLQKCKRKNAHDAWIESICSISIATSIAYYAQLIYPCWPFHVLQFYNLFVCLKQTEIEQALPFSFFSSFFIQLLDPEGCFDVKSESKCLRFICELIYQLNTSFVDKYFFGIDIATIATITNFWDCLPWFRKVFQGILRIRPHSACCDGND